jgi:EmrB/QacA subfamily drug resistance transporter
MAVTSRILPLTIAAALFMEQMDSTIIATSLVDISKDLGTSPVSLKLAFTTYLLGLTVVLPISGWAADRFGARTVFRLAIILFTASSFACGFAQSLEWLVLCRGLQGVAGALMVPVGRIILLRNVEKKDLLDAVAWLTIPALVGPVIGPVVGGFITTVYDWRWIFWMNLPFGIFALVLATWLMPELPPQAAVRLDVKGFLLSSVGLALAVFGFTVAGREMLAGWQVAAMILAGLLLLVAYVRHAFHAVSPILDLRLLRVASYRWSVIGGNLYRIPVGAAPFLLPLMLQLGFGLSAFETGLITFASALGALLMKFTVAPLVRRFGYRDVLIWNGCLNFLLVVAQAFFTVLTPYVLMFGVLLVSGFSRSLQFSSLNTLAYADIDQEDIARANALYTVLQQLFLALGVAVAAFVLDAQLLFSGRDVFQASDFSVALLMTSVFALVSVYFYTRLHRGAGASVSGRAAEDV